MTNRDKLKQIKLDYDLSNQDIADLLDVSLTTVISWLYPTTSKAHRPMKDKDLNYLNLLLAERNKQL